MISLQGHMPSDFTCFDLGLSVVEIHTHPPENSYSPKTDLLLAVRTATVDRFHPPCLTSPCCPLLAKSRVCLHRHQHPVVRIHGQCGKIRRGTVNVSDLATWTEDSK